METNSGKTLPAVLIVDDDPVCRFFYAHALAVLGYPTRAASTGDQAIQTALRDRPLVILIDMHLPDMSGVAAVTRLLQLRPDAKTDCRFIGLSGDDSPALRSAMQAAGFASILLKPCPTGTLVSSVQNAVNDLLETSGTRLRKRVPVESGTPPDAQQASTRHLQAVFRAELHQQLAELDRMITLLDWKRAAEVLHRLSGGAALAGFTELARCGRLLLQQLHHPPDARCLAQSYLDLLNEVAELDI